MKNYRQYPPSSSASSLFDKEEEEEDAVDDLNRNSLGGIRSTRYQVNISRNNEDGLLARAYYSKGGESNHKEEIMKAKKALPYMMTRPSSMSSVALHESPSNDDVPSQQEIDRLVIDALHLQDLGEYNEASRILSLVEDYQEALDSLQRQEKFREQLLNQKNNESNVLIPPPPQPSTSKIPAFNAAIPSQKSTPRYARVDLPKQGTSASSSSPSKKRNYLAPTSSSTFRNQSPLRAVRPTEKSLAAAAIVQAAALARKQKETSQQQQQPRSYYKSPTKSYAASTIASSSSSAKRNLNNNTASPITPSQSAEPSRGRSMSTGQRVRRASLVLDDVEAEKEDHAKRLNALSLHIENSIEVNDDAYESISEDESVHNEDSEVLEVSQLDAATLNESTTAPKAAHGAVAQAVAAEPKVIVPKPAHIILASLGNPQREQELVSDRRNSLHRVEKQLDEAMESGSGSYLLSYTAHNATEILQNIRNREGLTGGDTSQQKQQDADADIPQRFGNLSATVRGSGKADPTSPLRMSLKESTARAANAPTFKEKKGYLIKAPSDTRLLFGTTRRRWFILSGVVLVYCTKHTSTNPRGMIPLTNASVVVKNIPDDSSSPTKYLIELCVPERNNRVWKLYAESLESSLEWFAFLENNINVKKQQIETQTRREQKEEKLAKAEKKSASRPRSDSKVGVDLAASREEIEKLSIGEYYRLLGVLPNATDKEIKKVYRSLARDFHPDKHKDKDVDTSKFSAISNAFRVLMDPITRSGYDLCELVKMAFRIGVSVGIHEDDGEIWAAAMFLSADFAELYWQPEEFGSVLQPGYRVIEMRFVQQIVAGNDGFECPEGRADYILTFLGARIGYPHVRVEFDSPKARDDILDGLRMLRCEASMLFKQKLQATKEKGQR